MRRPERRDALVTSPTFYKVLRCCRSSTVVATDAVAGQSFAAVADAAGGPWGPGRDARRLRGPVTRFAKIRCLLVFFLAAAAAALGAAAYVTSRCGYSVHAPALPRALSHPLVQRRGRGPLPHALLVYSRRCAASLHNFAVQNRGVEPYVQRRVSSSILC